MLVDLFLLVILESNRREFVVPLIVEGVFLCCNHVRIDESINERENETYIFVVSHSATIIDHCSQNPYHRLLHIVSFFNHHKNLVFSHCKVCVAEILSGGTPPNGPKLLPIDQDGVEESSPEQ